MSGLRFSNSVSSLCQLSLVLPLILPDFERSRLTEMAY